MIRTEYRELDQLVRQHLKAGWYPSLAAHESATTFIQRHRDQAAKRVKVIKAAAAIAHNRIVS